MIDWKEVTDLLQSFLAGIIVLFTYNVICFRKIATDFPKVKPGPLLCQYLNCTKMGLSLLWDVSSLIGLENSCFGVSGCFRWIAHSIFHSQFSLTHAFSINQELSNHWNSGNNNSTWHKIIFFDKMKHKGRFVPI